MKIMNGRLNKKKHQSVKFMALIGFCIIGLVSVAFAEESSKFSQGNILLTPQFGYNSYSPVFGASLELGLTDNIGIGGSLMLGFWSENILSTKLSQSIINPSLDAYYHFNRLNWTNADLFMGLSLGYSIYSLSAESEWYGSEDSRSSGFYLSPIVGIRYYFSPKLILCAKSRYSAIGSFTGIGGEIGITFKLKK
jgi:hypothetical protein